MVRTRPLFIAALIHSARTLSLLGVTALLVGFATINSDQSRWQNTPSYSIKGQIRGLSDQEAFSVVRSAFNSWSSVQGGSLSFNEVNNGGDIPVEFLQSWPQEFGDNAAGLTFTQYSNGRISSAEVYINDDSVTWSTVPNPTDGSLNLGATTLHEIGHAIGLTHSFYFDATMYWTVGGTDRHILDEDDERGFRYLYGGVSAGRLCDTCQNHNECVSGQCFDFDGVSACGASCGPAPNYLCSDASTELAGCYELQAGGTTCLPLALTCDDEAVGVAEEGEYCFGAQHCPAGQLCVSGAEGGRCVRLGSAQLGAECSFSEACQSELCIPLSDTYAICGSTCNPQNPTCDGECYAIDDPNIRGLCVPSGEVPAGEVCDGLRQRCQSGLECQAGRCLSLCEPYGDCPSGLACTPVAGRWSCEPLTGPQEGEPCVDNRCGGGLFCLQSHQRCVTPCDPNDVGSCGGHLCFELSAIGICSPSDLAGGQACEEDLDCADFSCVPLPDGSGSACAPLCELGCPSGWECPAAPLGERAHCAPTSLEPPVGGDSPQAGVSAPQAGVSAPQAGAMSPPVAGQGAAVEGSLSGEAPSSSTSGPACTQQSSSGALPPLVICLLATYGVLRKRGRLQPQGGRS